VRVHQSMTRKPPIHQSHLPAAVGTSASANTPLSLRSPSCPVPVCNGNEVFARPALGLDMRSGVTAMCVQQTMPRKPPTHQRHLPAAVKYQDLEKRKRERRKARREDGRATDAKQARMHGRITVVCVESASPSPTHGEQPGGSVVQANPPFASYQLRGLETLISSYVSFPTQKCAQHTQGYDPSQRVHLVT